MSDTGAATEVTRRRSRCNGGDVCWECVQRPKQLHPKDPSLGLVGVKFPACAGLFNVFPVWFCGNLDAWLLVKVMFPGLSLFL